MRILLVISTCLLCAFGLGSCNTAIDGEKGPSSDTLPALRDVFQRHFLIGASVSPTSTYSDEAALLTRHFNCITTENVLKMGPVHPEEDRYEFAGGDSVAAFATSNGIRLRGHTLVWHKQAADWMFTEKDGSRVSRTRLLQRLKDHIQTVAARYRGKVYAWDVVNEAISDDSATFYTPTPFYDIIGEEYIELAFRWAHEADPDALLFYNDYRETDPVKRTKIIRLVQRLKGKGVPIHGVGLQCHWSIHSLREQELEACLADFSQMGLPVHITELDLSVWPGEPQRREKRESDSPDTCTAAMEERQRALYAMAFAKFRKYADAIDAVVFWNVSDRSSWLNHWPVKGRKDHPLLFDRELKPKKAFRSVVEADTSDRIP